MEFDIQYNGEAFELCEDFIDVGYMAENVEVKTVNEELYEIKRSHEDKAMTLIVSFPNLTNGFKMEALKVDHFMNDIQVPIYCYFVFHKNSEELKTFSSKLKKFEVVYDYDNEYGSMYGTKILNGSLKDKLTKALFLISKDGAVFYLDMQKDLGDSIDLARLQVELNKAYVSYTGLGCH
ncbi:MAG: hypothetical protein WBG69_05260 [Arcobacteraceae bacterium]